MNDLFDFLMGQQGGQQQVPVADYGYNPDTGLPNRPPQSQQQTYQPPLNSMLPGYTQPDMSQAPVMPTSPMPSNGGGSIFSNAGQQMYDIGKQMQGYAGTFGPTYDQEAQARFNPRPMLDRSVDGSMNSAPRGDPWGGIQGSPYAVISDSMGSSDPVHVLGVNGFRTGSSSPFVDYSGPMARQQAVRNNMNISDILGRQDAIRNSHNLDLQKMMMMSADRQDSIQQRRQADWDRNFMKLPYGKRGIAIDQGERDGVISPEVANKHRVEDVYDAGMVAVGQDPKTKKPKDFSRFLGTVASRFDPSKMSKDELLSKLIGVGYTTDEIYNEAQKNPATKALSEALLGKDYKPQDTSWRWLPGL